MILLDWIPELLILVQFFVAMLSLNFKPVTYRSLPLVFSLFTLAGASFFLMRTDLAYFSPPEKILVSDSVTYFGRIFSLLLLILGSLSIHLHRGMVYLEKQRALLFVLFLCLFLDLGFMSNSILLYALAWLGSAISARNLILVESKLHEGWIKTIRQQAFGFSLLLGLFFAFFTISSLSSGSIYFSEYIEWVKLHHEKSFSLLGMGVILFALGSVMTHGNVFRGKSPFALACMNLVSFVMVSVFWLRIGIPFLNASEFLSKNAAQLFLGLLFSGFTIRYVVLAIRTTGHADWLSAILPSLCGIGWFSLVLGGDHSLPAFYILSLAFLITFLLAGYSFQEEKYQNKFLMVATIFALVGAPPLEMGHQFFRLMHEMISADLLPLAVVIALTWFGATASSIQKVGKIALFKCESGLNRKLISGEVLFFVLYLFIIVFLTASRAPLVTLLNEHPAINLW